MYYLILKPIHAIQHLIMLDDQFLLISHNLFDQPLMLLLQLQLLFLLATRIPARTVLLLILLYFIIILEILILIFNINGLLYENFSLKQNSFFFNN